MQHFIHSCDSLPTFQFPELSVALHLSCAFALTLLCKHNFRVIRHSQILWHTPHTVISARMLWSFSPSNKWHQCLKPCQITIKPIKVPISFTRGSLTSLYISWCHEGSGGVTSQLASSFRALKIVSLLVLCGRVCLYVHMSAFKPLKAQGLIWRKKQGDVYSMFGRLMCKISQKHTYRPFNIQDQVQGALKPL